MDKDTKLQTENVFEELFQNIRKATEANLSSQREVLKQWETNPPNPYQLWPAMMLEFQKRWSDSVSALLQRHRQLLEREYDAAVELVEKAVQPSDATIVEDFRKRSEQLCRESLEHVKEVLDVQINEFQSAMATRATPTTRATPGTGDEQHIKGDEGIEPHRVELHRRAAIALEALPTLERERVMARFEMLRATTLNHDVRRLSDIEGETPLFIVRLDHQLRAIYTVTSIGTVVVLDVANHRAIERFAATRNGSKG